MSDSYDRLTVNLKKAKETYDGCDDHGRIGAALAASAAASYLKAIGIPKDLIIPLSSIVYALYDLDTGKVHPMLVTTSPCNRPGDLLTESHFKGLAAAAMELLMQSGQGKDVAARRVAQAVRNWPISVRQDFSSKTVIYWRDKAKKGTLDKNFDARAFYTVVYEAAKLSKPNKMIAEKILKQPQDFL